MSTIEELGSFLAREQAASTQPAGAAAPVALTPSAVRPDGAVTGAAASGGTQADAT